MPLSESNNSPVAATSFESGLREKPSDIEGGLKAAGQDAGEAQSPEIQQVNWTEGATSSPLNVTNTLATQAHVARPIDRQDAPPSYVVIACLIGFGIFSLVLCLSSLPHYWFQRDNTRR